MQYVVCQGRHPQALVDRLAQLVHSSYIESERIKSVRETLSDEDPALTGAALRAFIDRTWPTYRQLTRAAGIAAS
jgi:tripartite-type tricarboxylate transporter receptor subunit TctC